MNHDLSEMNSAPALHTRLAFEHDFIPYDWTDSHLASLAHLNRSTGGEVLSPVVQGRQRGFRTAQFVGLIRLEGETIEVLPKLYRGSHAAPQQMAARNLLVLLAHAFDLGLRDTGIASVVGEHGDWFEALAALFAARLMELWQRGPQRTYQSLDEDLPVLKGKLRVSEQLRRPEQYHRLAVRYDEFTVDHPRNQVLRAAVELLWQITRLPANRRQLGILREWLEQVTVLPPIVAAQMALPPLTRLDQHYAPLVNLARLLLQRAAPYLTHGTHETYAFVFDMNQLFESFLTGFIRRHRAAILPPSLARAELLVQARSFRQHLAYRDNGRPVFPLKPDLALRLDGGVPLLVDMKYKQLDASSSRLGVAPSDFYQMMAYAHRFACPHVLLLYPQMSSMTYPLRHTFHLVGSPTHITVHTVDLCRDLTSPASRNHLIAELAQGFAHAD